MSTATMASKRFKNLYNFFYFLITLSVTQCVIPDNVAYFHQCPVAHLRNNLGGIYRQPRKVNFNSFLFKDLGQKLFI